MGRQPVSQPKPGKGKSMINEKARKIASKCRHYAMCKIDYLGTGLCPSAAGGAFVSYYPQGRMDVYKYLADEKIPVTSRLLDIADTCTLCGNCDKQCYFVTELRPVTVMKALKEYVAEFRKQNKQPVAVESDDILKKLQEICGTENATNDPAVLCAYADDPCPLAPPVFPRYAVLPGTAGEISRIVTLCHDGQIPYAVRGNGGSVMGFVMSKGIVIDVNCMQDIEFDEANFCVHVQPGVAAFDIQKEAVKRGFRVNTAEPSALIAANIMCSGIFSLFSNTYGISADNYITAEFVGPDGTLFHLNQRDAPNLFSYTKEEFLLPGICTRVGIKLYPLLDDEQGILVPFPDFIQALEFAHNLARRRIGTGIGVLGGEYISTFMSPTTDLARQLKDVFSKKAGIQYLVLIIGDTYCVDAVHTMGVPVIDNNLFRMMMLGFPHMVNSKWLDILTGFESDSYPYEFMVKKELYPLLEAALQPSPGVVASAFDEDLRDFFTGIYKKDEMTDLVWLNMFRILSARMGREKHVLAFVVYVPLPEYHVIRELDEQFKQIGDRYHIKNDFGFLTPLDQGKRAVYEYDYYIDHTDPEEIKKVRDSIGEVAGMIEGLSARYKGLKWIKYTLYQGFCRSEHLLYT
jgi:heterodisulfide reductase subunit C